MAFLPHNTCQFIKPPGYGTFQHTKLPTIPVLPARSAFLESDKSALDLPNPPPPIYHGHAWLAPQTEVVLRPDSLAVVVRMRPVLRGALFARVKVDESTWFLEGRVLTLVLLKSSRRGCYQDGTTNADTFWKSVLKTPQQGECLEVRRGRRVQGKRTNVPFKSGKATVILLSRCSRSISAWLGQNDLLCEL